MAASKSYLARPNYRFLSGGDRVDCPISSDTVSFEFDESDIWNSTRSESPEFRKPVVSSRFSKRPAEKLAQVGATPSSLPVNVPDWSKILKEDYRRRGGSGNEDDGDAVDGGGNRIPPHELLARTRIASFSVHEGAGRTLKGRDLSRVRNAIWEKTGFED